MLLLVVPATAFRLVGQMFQLEMRLLNFMAYCFILWFTRSHLVWFFGQLVWLPFQLSWVLAGWLWYTLGDASWGFGAGPADGFGSFLGRRLD